MKSTTRLLVLAFIASFGFFSCSESPLTEPTSPSKPSVAPAPAHISKVADFKMILPKGNQIIADGVDMLNFKFLFLDKQGNEITGHNYYEFFSRVTVKGNNDVLFQDAIKSTQLGTYDISITINGITKSYPVVATTADKKIVEIPIIFNFVSTNYSDKVVDLTFTNLVNTYKEVGVDNVVFKLAEIDNDGKPLKRKGVKFWDYKGVATDLMDFKALWGNRFALNVYLIDNKTNIGASAYASNNSDGKYIVIDNSFVNLPGKADLEQFGFLQISHEIGHVLSLAHVYRDDNVCQVQEGVNDIQAVSSTVTNNYDWKTNTMKTICGGIQKADNIMGYGGNGEKYITRDQLKIAKKTALTLKF